MFNSDDVLVPEVVEAGFDPFQCSGGDRWLLGGLLG
jgi:hypothetical protein